MSNIFVVPVAPEKISVTPIIMANQDLPRRGLVALYDPYCDTYGRNILPVGSEDFVTGWNGYDGSVITITPNQPDPDGGNNAYRLQSTGGTNILKYILNPAVVSPTVGATYGFSIWYKNNSPSTILHFNNVTIFTSETLSSQTWTKITKKGTATTNAIIQMQLRTTDSAGSLDILVYQPQINLGTFYPYSPPAGLPQSLTDYTGRGNNAQLGSTAGADTNDPKFDGVALVGDGVDDYAVVPLASAAYRISVVDSGSGFVVVDEVPAYLNLFKTGAATYLNGKIGPTAYYNRVPTAAEIAQAKIYFKRLMSGRGVTVV